MADLKAVRGAEPNSPGAVAGVSSSTPVFQVLFVVQDIPAGGIELNGLEVTDFASEAPPSKFDLSLFLGELRGEMVGTFVYRTDLFNSGTIKRLAAQFTALVVELFSNPERSIEDVELMSPTACVADVKLGASAIS